MPDIDVKSFGPHVAKGTELGDKLKAAKTADEVVTILQGAGVKTTKAQLIRSQAAKLLELSDAELEDVHLFSSYTTDTVAGCATWVFGCCP